MKKVMRKVMLLTGLCFIMKGGVAAEAKEEAIEAFVYTELQISIPFNKVPWHQVNENIKKQPGFINKTWLAGADNNSAGGFYAFDSIEHAKEFVIDYFPSEARGFGVAHTTRVFEVSPTVAASKDINSVYFGGKLSNEPKAYVYTELQSNLETFGNKRWEKVNDNLKGVKGLLCKTWLYGSGTKAPGGFYAFDSVESATDFAINQFPQVAKRLGVAYYTRIFDSNDTKAASVEMNSPFYN